MYPRSHTVRLLRTLPLAIAAAATIGLFAPAAAIGAPAKANGGETCGVSRWLRPVTAPIVDPFRSPSGPYGPGNRGIEYGTVEGDRVIAVDAGEVIFAGPVGGDRFVVIRHPGNLRSTYGFLSSIEVGRGAVIDRGALIANTGPGFHLTARRGANYLDPAVLLAEHCFVVRLVPLPPSTEWRSSPGFEANLNPSR